MNKVDNCQRANTVKIQIIVWLIQYIFTRITQTCVTCTALHRNRWPPSAQRSCRPSPYATVLRDTLSRWSEAWVQGYFVAVVLNALPGKNREFFVDLLDTRLVLYLFLLPHQTQEDSRFRLGPQRKEVKFSLTGETGIIGVNRDSFLSPPPCLLKIMLIPCFCQKLLLSHNRLLIILV